MNRLNSMEILIFIIINILIFSDIFLKLVSPIIKF